MAFLGSPFWTTEQYIGAGPFALVSRDPGVRVALQANPYFVFGRPKIDALELVVVPDKNGIVVRLLAGEIDFAEHADINPLDAQTLGDHWKISSAGQVYAIFRNNRGLRFQQRDVAGHQKALLDLRVRRAVVHAIDREAMGRAETAGLAGTSDSTFPPDDPLWPRIERAITTYPFDTRRTETLLNEAGWSRATDGIFRNIVNETLDVEVNASSDYPRSPVIVADDLKRAGLNAKPVLTPDALDTDGEYRASYPGVTIPGGTPWVYTTLSRAGIPTAVNGWRGQNRSSYSHPELNMLVDRLNSTLDGRARDDLFVEIEALISADVAVGQLYYQVRPAAALSSLKGITGLGGSYAWNVWEWRFE
jgi:peptide/nickel transport system substrate-binding protein